MHDKHRRSQTHRASPPRLTRRKGPLVISPDAIVTVHGRSGIWAWQSARCALWVNLDAMRVKSLAWLGIPGGDYAAAVLFFGETLSLEVTFDARKIVELAAGNGDRVQLLAPATANSSSTAAAAPASSRCSRRTTWIRRAPSRPAVTLSCSEDRSQTAPGPGSPSGCPTGASTAWPRIAGLAGKKTLVERARYAACAGILSAGLRCINMQADGRILSWPGPSAG
jgi:hypothetical protein